MGAVRIHVAVDRDGLDTHLLQRPADADGDLTAVGDENALERGLGHERRL
jgi:hypothetical protein